MKPSPKMNEPRSDVVIPEGSYVLVTDEDKRLFPCWVDAFLASQMRPHQHLGVKFMFDCLCGFKAPEISGCILAVSEFELSN